jgi:predicted transcriptional regulator
LTKHPKQRSRIELYLLILQVFAKRKDKAFCMLNIENKVCINHAMLKDILLPGLLEKGYLMHTGDKFRISVEGLKVAAQLSAAIQLLPENAIVQPEE